MKSETAVDPITQALRAFIGWPSPPLGALSRVADYLQCHHNLVRRWLADEDDGGWKIAKKWHTPIRRMIRRKISLRPKYHNGSSKRKSGSH